MRYHLTQNPSQLALSDLRTILYSYLFAKTADQQKQGQFILTVPEQSEDLKAAMTVIRDRLGLGWEEGPDNLPAKCVQAEKKREYLKFAQSLIEVSELLSVYPRVESRCLLLLLHSR